MIVRKQQGGVRKGVKKKVKPAPAGVDPRDLTPQERLVNKVRETLNLKGGEERGTAEDEEKEDKEKEDKEKEDKEKEDNSTTEIHSGHFGSHEQKVFSLVNPLVPERQVKPFSLQIQQLEVDLK